MSLNEAEAERQRAYVVYLLSHLGHTQVRGNGRENDHQGIYTREREVTSSALHSTQQTIHTSISPLPVLLTIIENHVGQDGVYIFVQPEWRSKVTKDKGQGSGLQRSWVQGQGACGQLLLYPLVWGELDSDAARLEIIMEERVEAVRKYMI